MWTVAMTKANCELVAATNLERQGYNFYLPRFKSQLPGKKAVTKVLFPRYLFIEVEGKWYSLLSTYGISKVLMAGGKPQAIDPQIIADLKERESNGFITLNPKARFQMGENVKVADGPLCGYSMLYEGMSGPARARVLIEMLGRQVSLTVDEKVLIAA
jgi:transcriptional antiterminator RfaH